MGEKLRSVYASVDDIDLWIGGLLEPKMSDSILGPTFRDIVADQFSRLKRGDKYFFENDPSINPGAFTPGNEPVVFWRDDVRHKFFFCRTITGAQKGVDVSLDMW